MNLIYNLTHNDHIEYDTNLYNIISFITYVYLEIANNEIN